MTIIDKSFFKLSELAGRWGKTEDDILHMLEAGLMPAYFWHEGYVESLLRKPGRRYLFKGFVRADHPVPLQLLLGKKAEIVHLCPYSEPFGPDRMDLLSPMQQLIDDTLEDITTPLLVAVTDLVVMAQDVERMEEADPNLTKNKRKQTVPTILPEPKADLITISDEKALMGRQAIADYLGVSVTTIKNYMKNAHFPAFPQGGLRCAYPSELESWRQSQKNK